MKEVSAVTVTESRRINFAYKIQNTIKSTISMQQRFKNNSNNYSNSSYARASTLYLLYIFYIPKKFLSLEHF